MSKTLSRAVLLITAMALLFSGALSTVFFRQRELSAARSSLSGTLAILNAQRQETDVEELTRQFSAAAPGLRLTFISPEGEVLADTDSNTEESHADRSEVKEALRDGAGEDVRRSATTGVTCLYVALRFSDGVIGRAAMPVSSVNGLIWQAAAVQLITATAVMLMVRMVARRWARETAAPIEARQEKLENVRSEFAANVSHELKTPLTSIKGFTDMLASGMVTDPADRQRFYTMIGVEVDRLMELINDLLKLSELENVAMPRPDDRAEVLAVCRSAAESLAALAGERGVTLAVTGEEAAAAIPPARLREVALNLMENGLKYTEKGGTVTATVGWEGDRAVLTVADNGIGIPEEAKERVFERFYRVDKGRTRQTGGSGLGLSIVKHITLLYGGSLKLDSTLGKGTVITVSLPGVGGNPESTGAACPGRL